MKGSMRWLSMAERTRTRRKWRRMRIQEAAGRNAKWLQCVLCLFIGAESVYLLQRYDQKLDFQIFHVEEDYHIEWSQENDLISGEKFGIRWNPEKMEVEFYHQMQEMRQ